MAAYEQFEEHLRSPAGSGVRPPGGHAGFAGGAACGDLISFTVAVGGEGVVTAGFVADGCGALTACGSAVCTLTDGLPLLDAARVGVQQVSDEVGGLSAAKLHAAELAVDAFHRALGAAACACEPLAGDPGLTLVAMSGGVDSAVAALLSGSRVAGVTVELWRDEESDPRGSCCSAVAVRAARSMAHRQGWPHLTVDLRDEFRAGVVEPWIAAHAAGDTPNPCVACNGRVRLGRMVDLADSLGAAALATGHYARISDDGLLRAARSREKDQSYMLARLDPQTIARLRFPLGEMTKPEVRRMAREHGLAVAEAPESQDLCFLAGTTRERFLARHGELRAQPGKVVDRAGEVVGEHSGHFAYTVGQRRGLRVHRAEAQYVLATDAATNTVTVGPREALAATSVAISDVQLHGSPERVDRVKLRYRSEPVRCTLEGDRLSLHGEALAVAPGQAAVLLAGDVVLGCGTIART